MIDFTLQLLSLILVAAGLQFILIETLVRFDRTFLFLGLALILFGFVPAVDIWIIPREHEPEQILLWTRVQHVLTVMLFPLILWYLNNFLKSSVRYLRYSVVALAIFFSPMLFSGAAISIDGGAIAYGPWYRFLVLPSAAIACCVIVGLILDKLRETRDNERRVLFYHLVGFSLLCAFGMIDLLVKSMSWIVYIPFPSFFILGVFAFGSMAFLIFTERFLLLVRERQAANEKLRVALREMEEASTLRQIGESTSVINHEIKNYLVSIKGSAELIKLTENLSDDGKESINVIMKTAGDLQNFSMDVLQLSRAKIVKEKELLTIVPLLRQSIGAYFPDHRNDIMVNTPDERYTIHGEWNKLEHVFVNLFKNAFEAEASALVVQLQSTGSVLLITVCDNGVGCSPAQEANLFKAFYTTKKGRHGTGLGLSISRAVIESHGGHLTAYSLNALGNGAHGLKLNMSIPHFAGEYGDKGEEIPEIVVIREEMKKFRELLNICGNVGVYPLVVQSAGELEKAKNPVPVTVLAAESLLARIHRKCGAEKHRSVLISGNNGLLFARNAAHNAPIELFSEDFVVYKLLAR